jgi:Cu2+-exporting ATPase
MMCPHCEASVKAALEALGFVDSAAPNREKGEVELTLCGDFDEAAAKKAVEDRRFVYIG